MAFHVESDFLGNSGANCLSLGALDPHELSVFTTLIDQRRPLPIYLGDVWRCDVCIHECTDIGQMGAHIITAHEPEPMNDDDWEELRRDGREKGRRPARA
jgi:hypothetical protein